MEFLHSKTGSDGNCTVITDGVTTIAIDCGIPLGALNKEIGYSLSKIKSFFVTHHHADHFKYANEVINRCTLCYMPPDCLDRLRDYNYFAKSINPLDNVVVGTMKIKSFLLPHTNSDGSNCVNYGYFIYSSVTDEKLLWCTDCKYINNRFPPCDYYCVECNYISVDGENEKSVDYRRLESHMSLRNCKLFLSRQDLSKAKEIRLLHFSKSEENKETKYISKKEIQEMFPEVKVIV